MNEYQNLLKAQLELRKAQKRLKDLENQKEVADVDHYYDDTTKSLITAFVPKMLELETKLDRLQSLSDAKPLDD